MSVHLGIHGTLLQVNGVFGDTHCIDVCMDNCSRRETNYCFVTVLSNYVFIYHVPSFPFWPSPGSISRELEELRSVHHQFCDHKQGEFVHAPLNTIQANYFS